MHYLWSGLRSSWGNVWVFLTCRSFLSQAARSSQSLLGNLSYRKPTLHRRQTLFGYALCNKVQDWAKKWIIYCTLYIRLWTKSRERREHAERLKSVSEKEEKPQNVTGVFLSSSLVISPFLFFSLADFCRLEPKGHVETGLTLNHRFYFTAAPVDSLMHQCTYELSWINGKLTAFLLRRFLGFCRVCRAVVSLGARHDGRLYVRTSSLFFRRAALKHGPDSETHAVSSPSHLSLRHHNGFYRNVLWMCIPTARGGKAPPHHLLLGEKTLGCVMQKLRFLPGVTGFMRH